VYELAKYGERRGNHFSKSFLQSSWEKVYERGKGDAGNVSTRKGWGKERRVRGPIIWNSIRGGDGRLGVGNAKVGGLERIESSRRGTVSETPKGK